MIKWTRFANPDLQKLVPVLTVVMEVIWTYAWLAWISGLTALNWPGPPLNFLSCAVQTLAVLGLTRFAYSRKWSLKITRIVVIAIALVLLIVLIRWTLGGTYSFWSPDGFRYAGTHLTRVLIGCFFGLFLIWRGISISVQRNNFGEVYRKFVIGLVFLIILLIIWSLTENQGTPLWPAAGIYVVTFFGVGTLALAISNLANLRSELLKHQESTGSFGRRWITMLVPLILVILAFSLGLGSAFSLDFAQQLLHFLSHLGDWVAKGLYYVLLPLIYLMDWVIYLLRWLVSLIRQEPPPQNEEGGRPDWDKLAEGQPLLSLPVWLISILKWGGLVLITGLILFFLSRILVRYWINKNEDDVDEVHETLGSWKLIKSDLWSFLKWLFRWIRKPKKVPLEIESPPAPVIAGEKESLRLFNIRELYQALLWQGRKMGFPRRRTETPYEYSQKLKSNLTMLKEEIDTLTEAYVIYRYNLSDPTPEKVTFLNQAWRSLIAKVASLTQNKDQGLPGSS